MSERAREGEMEEGNCAQGDLACRHRTRDNV